MRWEWASQPTNRSSVLTAPVTHYKSALFCSAYPYFRLEHVFILFEIFYRCSSRLPQSEPFPVTELHIRVHTSNMPSLLRHPNHALQYTGGAMIIRILLHQKPPTCHPNHGESFHTQRNSLRMHALQTPLLDMHFCEATNHSN